MTAIRSRQRGNFGSRTQKRRGQKKKQRLLLRTMHRRLRGVDVIRVQEAALIGSPDEGVLTWAAREGRALMTHDATTMTAAVYARIAADEACQG